MAEQFDSPSGEHPIHPGPFEPGEVPAPSGVLEVLKGVIRSLRRVQIAAALQTLVILILAGGIILLALAYTDSSGRSDCRQTQDQHYSRDLANALEGLRRRDDTMIADSIGKLQHEFDSPC